jgi:hypothetical protein
VSEDNVRDLPLSPQALITMAARVAESFKPAPPPDPELTLWDEVVRMRLSTMSFAGPDEPATTVDEAIDAANRVVLARRKFASER